MSTSQPKSFAELQAQINQHGAAHSALWDEIDAAVAAAAKDLDNDRNAQDVLRTELQPEPQGDIGTAAEDTEQPPT